MGRLRSRDAWYARSDSDPDPSCILALFDMDGADRGTFFHPASRAGNDTSDVSACIRPDLVTKIWLSHHSQGDEQRPTCLRCQRANLPCTHGFNIGFRNIAAPAPPSPRRRTEARTIVPEPSLNLSECDTPTVSSDESQSFERHRCKCH